MKKKIILELHETDNAFVLNIQDVYKYIGETSNDEIELAFYLNKWCEFLNYYVFHNKELAFGDEKYARLDGWIDGYNHAKSIHVDDYADRVEIEMKKYRIILSKPHEKEHKNHLHDQITHTDSNKCCLFCHSPMSGTGLDGTDILVCFNCAGKENLEMEVYEDDYCENFN